MIKKALKKTRKVNPLDKRHGENNNAARAWDEFRASALPALPSSLLIRAKIKDPKEMYERAYAYFEECNEHKRPYSMAGLCLAWGINKTALHLTYKDKEGFQDVLCWARGVMEAQLEKGLWVPKIASGIAFSLKNHFGWVDKHEVEHSGSVDFAHWLKSTVDPNAPKEEEPAQVEVIN